MSKSRAIEAFRAGTVSVNEAARLAGVSIGEWFEVAREEGLTYQLSVADLEEDAESVRDQ